jgi:hypothetical protein
MASEPWPPVAANDKGTLLTLTWHLSTVGAVSDVVVLLHARRVAAPESPSANATFRSRHRIKSPEAPNACASPRQRRNKSPILRKLEKKAVVCTSQVTESQPLRFREQAAVAGEHRGARRRPIRDERIGAESVALERH